MAEGVGETAYGIRAEKVWRGEEYQTQYVAYMYEPDPDAETPVGRQYVYSMRLKRWLTLEVALLWYAVRGITCFPIFGSRPDRIPEKEILRLSAEGFAGLSAV